MGRRNDEEHDLFPADAQKQGPVVHDHRWAGDMYSSIRCSTALLGLLFVFDWGAGSLTVVRGTLWTTLAVLLFLALCPPRVTAGEGWLASRWLLRTRRVRTDLLVSVRCLEGVSQRLVLRDAFGDRVEIDPQVLVNNPGLWHRVDEDARRAAALGSLMCGATVLRRVAERIDRETAETVFKVSGLE
ncbi:hypothetical protein DI272_24325 [Streptomyces sp. Act143]|uniref:hypothetical protein n=1 Tax=Streptomyces sp. Act143 TaxID=2200760 RepID=UPI000D67915A|nr:hypothetical protein [Streptomyces sp. Act143]PWI16944.1 hypothetical protein DI272_24325 [Streptomyces sp. Act143]